MKTKIVIGGDHAGFEYKSELIKKLQEEGHEVEDFGAFSADSVDYPDFAHPVSVAVEQNEDVLGILICGSGNGVAMTANKHPGIRAAICWQVELASLAREHNDANVLCLPARFIPVELAWDITKAFVSNSFEGGRHARRVDKISSC